MNIIVVVSIFVLLNCTAESSLLDPVIENVRHIKAAHPPDKVSGMWKKKMLWKPRWIKEWKSSNVLKPVWKKFWGPVIIREWVPIPKPPPQWDGVHVGPAEPSGAPLLDVGEPPSPNFSYLLKNMPPGSRVRLHGSSIRGGFSSGSQTSYKVPQLPITSGFKSQAETYSGQASYESNLDNSAYDLNPPVEQFNPRYSYSTPAPSVSGNRYMHHGPLPLVPLKPAPSHTHNHHNHNHHYYHQQHRFKSNGHTHLNSSPDLTKFPPDWNSWETIVSKPRPHSSGLAQASSAVSVVSQAQSTATGPNQAVSDHLFSHGVLPADNEFIQQASLVSEYHYTEQAVQNSTPAPPPDSSPHASFTPHPIRSSGTNQTKLHVPVSGFLGDSVRTLPSKPIPIESTSTSVPLLNPNLIASHGPAPSRPLSGPPNSQTPPAHRKPNPDPVQSSKVSFPHNRPPVPSQKPSLTTPRANPTKFPSSGSFLGPIPVSPQRPASVYHPAPVTTRPHISDSGSTPGLAPVRPQIPLETSMNKKVPAHPRKPAPVALPSPSGSSPHHNKNSQPPKSGATKPESQKGHKLHTTANEEIPKVPDFKALPSASVEAFHFIEGFPSNHTLSKAALIGNIHNVGTEENQVEIISAQPHRKEVPPFVAKLAQAIVNEHLKKSEKTISQSSTKVATSEAPTEREAVTVVYPSTNPFVRKTLKAYLEEEGSSEKSTKVFVVTPVPQNVENSTDVAHGV